MDDIGLSEPENDASVSDDLTSIAFLKAIGPSDLMAVAAVSCVIASFSAHAERPFTFDSEVTTSYASDSSNMDLSATIYAVDVKRYFDHVGIQSGPVAEAAFLAHASGFSIDFYLAGVDAADGGDDELGVNFGIRHVFGGFPFVVSANVASYDTAAARVYDSGAGFDTSTLGIEAGAYAMQGTYIGVEFSKAETTPSSANDETSDQSFTSFGVTAKSVIELMSGAAFTMTGGWERTTPDDGEAGDVNAVNFGVDVYLNPQASVGIRVVTERGDGGDDAQTRAVTLRSFFAEQASVSFEYAQFTDDVPAANTTYKQRSYAIGIGGRF